MTKKPQKLASAVYLLTSFFVDQEPMKWKLRSLASDLVSISEAIKDNFSPRRHELLLQSRSLASETVSLLVVAKNAGLISEPNYDILHKEFSGLLDTLALPEGVEKVSGKPVLALSFAGEAAAEPSSHSLPEPSYLRDKNYPSPSREGARAEETKPVVKDKVASTPKDSSQPALREFGPVSLKKNNRKSVIIGLLKRKKEIMIKDVSPLISGCSEKTIQRELLGMVKEGILKKEGEKRWSRYSLARP